MRSPGLTCALLLTIALGVGANAAIYGFLERLTHPVSPVRSSATIVSVFRKDRSREAGPLSFHDFQKLERVGGVWSWIAAVRIETLQASIDGTPEVVTVAAVAPELSREMAIPLDTGAVISHRIWQTEYGGRVNPLGSPIHFEDGDYKVGGVAPAWLEGLYSDQRVDVWMKSDARDAAGGDQSRRDLWVLAALQPGVSLRQAESALGTDSSGADSLSLDRFTGMAPASARGLARVGLFLNFSAAAVFFIACINVASFLLGRALKRTHETSLRIALGATREELMQELLADSMVISVAGGAVGLLLGISTARILPAFLFEEDAQRLGFAPHLFPIAAASLACVVITVVCGMLPVAGTVTDRPWMVLQRETGLPSRGMQRLRAGLVVGQIAACCVLVICTAVLVSSLQAALKTDAGHRLGNPVLLTVQAQTRPKVDTDYFVDVERRAQSLPGEAVLAWTSQLPGSPADWREFKIQQFSSQYRDVAMDIAWLTPESLQQLESEPVAGRMFGINDQRYRVAIVDEEAAARLFGRQTAGMVIRDSAGLPLEIIGVFRRKGEEGKQQRRPTIYYGYLEQGGEPKTIRDARFRVPIVPPRTGAQLNASAVSAGYFSALDLPLIAGRRFREGRYGEQERVGMINQEAADVYFNGKPLGSAVIDDNGMRTEIVGVVGSRVFGTFEQHAEPAIYFPMWQECPARMTLLLRDARWNSGRAASLRRAIESVPGRGPGAIGLNTLDRQLAQSGLAGLRIAALIGGASAVIAVMLGMLGLLSAQADAERQRQRERAVRIALGAQRWRIVWMVVNRAGGLALMGTAIGTPVAFGLSRMVIAGISAVSPPTLQVWLMAPLLPAALVMLASVIPARRASSVSPAVVMREN